ncbi:MAG: hypothetical protein RMM29_08165, partial [Planctomycetota bacterium]|nr:hypothetical protein [Planctomycetota bacterium]
MIGARQLLMLLEHQGSDRFGIDLVPERKRLVGSPEASASRLCRDLQDLPWLGELVEQLLGIDRAQPDRLQ